MTRIDAIEDIFMPTEELIETVAQSSDTFKRFQRYTSGKMEFGSGAAAVDTNLYRSAADVLKTDDALVVGGTLNVTGIVTLTAAQKVPVTTISSVTGSTGPVTNHGISYITSTKAQSYILASPVAGCQKTIIKTGTGTLVTTILSTSATFDGTNDQLTFNAANEAVILVGLTATRWGVVSNVGSVGIS